jgi:hypothetical protein
VTLKYLEAQDRADVFVPHAFDEYIVDLGEIRMNYSTAGDPAPAAAGAHPGTGQFLVGVRAGHVVAGAGIPGLRGRPARAGAFDLDAGTVHGRQLRQRHGPVPRSGRRPPRDHQRALLRRRGRGLAVGLRRARAGPRRRLGGLADLLLRGQPGLWSLDPAGIGSVFALWNKWLGDKWSIGDVDGMQAMPRERPATLLASFPRMAAPPTDSTVHPMQNLREYDPEWGRAFVSGSPTASCDHENLLAHVRVPVLFTRHHHEEHPLTPDSPVLSLTVRCSGPKHW